VHSLLSAPSSSSSKLCARLVHHLCKSGSALAPRPRERPRPQSNFRSRPYCDCSHKCSSTGRWTRRARESSSRRAHANSHPPAPELTRLASSFRRLLASIAFGALDEKLEIRAANGKRGRDSKWTWRQKRPEPVLLEERVADTLLAEITMRIKMPAVKIAQGECSEKNPPAER